MRHPSNQHTLWNTQRRQTAQSVLKTSAFCCHEKQAQACHTSQRKVFSFVLRAVLGRSLNEIDQATDRTPCLDRYSRELHRANREARDRAREKCRIVSAPTSKCSVRPLPMLPRYDVYKG